MTILKSIITNPEYRRKYLVLITGSLILTALIVSKVAESSSIPDLLMIAAALLAGADIAVRAFNSLLNRHISIELLVTIATIGAIVIGEYWEAAAVTFLFVLGAYLEARTLSRTRRVLADLLDSAPTTAIVIRDGRQREVMPHEVRVGEQVLVKPGTKIPVDGQVIEGLSAVDESAITGESIPTEKTIGSQVFAGTVNRDGFFKLQATGVGADTTLARIIRRVEEAQDEKAPTQRFIERFAQWYTPFIIALSSLAYILSRDVELSLTLLVIGCPGALVISTPVSVVSGIGRAARHGILIKGGEYLENAGRITAIAFDKTGTLTQGKPRLTDVIALPKLVPVAESFSLTANLVPTGAQMHSNIPANSAEVNPIMSYQSQDLNSPWSQEQKDVIVWAAIAELHSEHPFALAIIDAADKLGTIPSPDDFKATPGRGVSASYQGYSIIVGTAAFIKELRIKLTSLASDHLDSLKENGKTAVLLALNDQVVGVLGIADTIRPNTRGVIQRLKALGLEEIVMLTGDDPLTAQAIARQVGLDHIEAGLLPEDKFDAVRTLQQDGHVVAMIGDGINDVPALAAADIGIAMGAAGTGVTIETADIALMADDLSKIPEAIGISKATLLNIRQNVAIALLTVGGLLLGILLGKVHMAGGMLIHEASVLIVILNGMRLLREQ